jgi:hypothetical protein
MQTFDRFLWSAGLSRIQDIRFECEQGPLSLFPEMSAYQNVIRDWRTSVTTVPAPSRPSTHQILDERDK